MPSRQVTWEAALGTFCRQNNIDENSHGAICAMIHVTRQARRWGLPLWPQQLVAPSGAQLAGLHRAGIRSILTEYGIEMENLGEAGRTNPNNVMRAYNYA
jgi:hypothetical protein